MFYLPLPLVSIVAKARCLEREYYHLVSPLQLSLATKKSYDSNHVNSELPERTSTNPRPLSLPEEF